MNWTVIYLGILLVVLVVLWVVFKLAYPSTIYIGRFESKEDAEKFVREFEAALDRDKDKARNFLGGRSMM